MVIFVPGTVIDGGIYCRDRNEEMRLTMVLEVSGVAGGGWTAIAPRTEPYGLALQSAQPVAKVAGEEAGGVASTGRVVRVVLQRGWLVGWVRSGCAWPCVTG